MKVQDLKNIITYPIINTKQERDKANISTVAKVGAVATCIALSLVTGGLYFLGNLIARGIREIIEKRGEIRKAHEISINTLTKKQALTNPKISELINSVEESLKLNNQTQNQKNNTNIHKDAYLYNDLAQKIESLGPGFLIYTQLLNSLDSLKMVCSYKNYKEHGFDIAYMNLDTHLRALLESHEATSDEQIEYSWATDLENQKKEEKWEDFEQTLKKAEAFVLNDLLAKLKSLDELSA